MTKAEKQVASPILTAGKETASLFGQVLLGAGLWLFLLLCLAPRGWETLLAGQTIPSFWQNVYLLGLYLWLGICLKLGLQRSGQNKLAWGLGPNWFKHLAPAFGSGLLIFGCLWLWGCASGQLDLKYSGEVFGRLFVAEWPQLLLLSLGCLIAAWALAAIEEGLFRAWFWQVWLPALGSRPLLLIQALLFSAVHGESWRNGSLALHLFLIGLVLGGLRHVTGRLGASMGLHAGWIWAVLCLNQWGLLATPQGTYNPLHEGSLGVIWLGPLAWIAFQWRKSEAASAKNAAGSASVA